MGTLPILHEATALRHIDFRRFEQSFQLTDRLRTEGTDNLLAAAESTGVKRFVAQSYAGWPYARVGGRVKAEDDPLDPAPAKEARRTVAAIRHLEQAITSTPGIEGIVLRYGGFYGIARARPGRRVGRRCVRPRPANLRRKRCIRYVRVARFAAQGRAGANTKTFSGRIGRRVLAPGGYRATPTARDVAGNVSLPTWLAFTVIRR